MRELDTLVARQDSVVWRTSYARQVAERVLLFRLLASRGDAYRDYQRRTSAFIPWFPKS